MIGRRLPRRCGVHAAAARPVTLVPDQSPGIPGGSLPCNLCCYVRLLISEYLLFAIASWRAAIAAGLPISDRASSK